MVMEPNRTHLLSIYLKYNFDSVSQYWKLCNKFVPLSLRVFQEKLLFRVENLKHGFLFGPLLSKEVIYGTDS